MAQINTRFSVTVDGDDFCSSKIQKIVYSPEKVWSENTRRNSNAKMTGRIKAVKWKLEISFAPNLTPIEMNNLMAKINSTQGWHTVVFTTAFTATEAQATGETLTKSMYFGNPSYEPYWYVPVTSGGVTKYDVMYQSMNISLIER